METDSIAVIDDPSQAAALFQPLRRQILEALDGPDSAAGVARRLELPRQKVNYHLRELERVGLVEEVEERRKGNCIEKVVRAKARRFVVSPHALGELGIDDQALVSVKDRFSWAYLTSAAARIVGDLGKLRRRAQSQKKRIPTFTLETEVRFATPAEMLLFAEELTEQVSRLVSKYHNDAVARGRRFRFVIGGYPKLGGR